MTNEHVDIRLIDKANLQSIVPLLHERNPALSTELLSARVVEMTTQGFQCFGAYQGDELIGVAGFWIKTRYHTGRVIEPDGVFVRHTHRSHGVGQKLAQCIVEFGQANACLEGELHCYVSNADAHRFWINQGYRIIAFHFGKTL